MTAPPHVLLLDLGPAREDLVGQIKALGAECTLTHGLHDALVQCIIRNPACIIADLSGAGTSGELCRRRLAEIEHFRDIPFFAIGGPGMPWGAAEQRELIQRVRALLPGSPSDPTTAAGMAPAAPAEAAPGASLLDEALWKLAQQGRHATLVVHHPDGLLGEVMVRGGVPIHAVTSTGHTAQEALDEIRRWAGIRIDTGPEPRPETPRSLTPAPQAPPPQAAAPVAKPPVPEDRHIRAVLDELVALGIIRETAT